MAGTAREEAERLVATVLAMAGQSGRGGASTDGATSGDHQRGRWATGSAECCVCPLCRVIAGMRDPGLETTVRLAGGAADFATGVASLMRAVSVLTNDPRPKPARPARPAPPTPDQAWSTATRVAAPAGRDDAPAGRDDAPADGGTRADGGTPPAGSDVWSAASSADAAAVAAERRAKAAGKAAEAARRTARRAAAADATREAADATRKAAEAAPPRSVRGDVWAAATGETGVAPSPDVDHDVAGPTVDGAADADSESAGDS